MTRTLGWDLGGAHLKAVLAEDGRILKVWQLPTPIWRDLDSLGAGIDRILDEAGAVERHGVTMTGELSDIFSDRAEGVGRLAALAEEKLGGAARLYAGAAGFVPVSEGSSHVKDVASANWHASSAITARRIGGDALFLDMGSTTTDLVPIKAEAVSAAGQSDAERLLAGELVYTGFTRTPLMAVARGVPFRGQVVPVMAEFFATMADVHRLTRSLNEDDDQHPAADGQEKTPEASRARLARMLGLDAADGSEDNWEEVADAFSEAQIRKIHDAALLVLSRAGLSDDAPVVIAGAGRPALRRLAARLDRGVVDFADLLDCPAETRDPVCRVAPAAALALMAAEDEDQERRAEF